MNNEAIEALKKAHAKELATHVQEHNRKYSDLLQAKMDSEDQLKDQFEKEKARINSEWQQKMHKAVEETKRTLETQWQAKLKDLKDNMQTQIDSQHSQIEMLND